MGKSLNAAKLRTAMFNKRMSQTELAMLTGISRNTINGIMNGRSTSEKTAEKICQALDVYLEDVLEGG